jgi:hypothetical protein
MQLIGERGDMPNRWTKTASRLMTGRVALSHEIMITVWPFFLGALCAWDVERHLWVMVALNGALSVVLAAAAVYLHRARRLALEVVMHVREATEQRALAAEAERGRLRQVALSALALKLTIEHGFPPNLDALTRDLAAVVEVQSVTVTRAPAGQPETGWTKTDRSKIN